VRTASPSPASSDLAALVDAEARLDRALADARASAQAVRDAARRRADDAAAVLDAEIEHERARLATEIAAATDAQLAAIADRTRAELARYETVRGDVLDDLARRLADRLVAVALDEAAP